MRIALLFYLIIVGSNLTAQNQDSTFVETGKASYYSSRLEGAKTASGERYRASLLTAAHRTLPFGTLVKVTNITNQQSVRVRINDRGPHSKSRIIDVSKEAAKQLDMIRHGIITATIQVEEEDACDE